MASVAEQLASNINFGVFAKATELKKRLWFTLGCLIVYRLGTYVPLPGIDPLVMEQIFHQQSGGILGMFNMFSGGALARMSIFALGIHDVVGKSLGSTNPHNMVKATFDALVHVVSPRLIAAKRGRKVADILGRRDTGDTAAKAE